MFALALSEAESGEALAMIHPLAHRPACMALMSSMYDHIDAAVVPTLACGGLEGAGKWLLREYCKAEHAPSTIRRWPCGLRRCMRIGSTASERR
jgi:hypothetical protein